MLILEKFRNKYHQIWITVDGEKRDTKLDCRLKGPGRRVVMVDIISYDNDSGNDSGDDSEDHEASSETITHKICPWTFTSSLINCSNASIPFVVGSCCT
jgi:hypothetical protein